MSLTYGINFKLTTFIQYDSGFRAVARIFVEGEGAEVQTVITAGRGMLQISGVWHSVKEKNEALRRGLEGPLPLGPPQYRPGMICMV